MYKIREFILGKQLGSMFNDRIVIEIPPFMTDVIGSTFEELALREGGSYIRQGEYREICDYFREIFRERQRKRLEKDKKEVEEKLRQNTEKRRVKCKDGYIIFNYSLFRKDIVKKLSKLNLEIDIDRLVNYFYKKALKVIKQLPKVRFEEGLRREEILFRLDCKGLNLGSILLLDYGE